MLAYVLLHLLPVSPFVADFLAPRADWQQTCQHSDLFQRFFGLQRCRAKLLSQPRYSDPNKSKEGHFESVRDPAGLIGPRAEKDDDASHRTEYCRDNTGKRTGETCTDHDCQREQGESRSFPENTMHQQPRYQRAADCNCSQCNAAKPSCHWA